MKSCGIIVEYNPLHNGHIYHIKKSKEITKSDVVVAVMSSNFVQRGEPAIIDKWTRTKLALESGVDLVLELPSFYSSQSADIFAFGAVSILNELKVDTLVFGSESGDIKIFEKFVSNYLLNKKEIDIKVKENLKIGNSYPNALISAIKEICQNDFEFLPNNILGIEYVKNIITNKMDLKFETIKRIKANYYEEKSVENITSASFIRKQILNNKFDSIINTTPKNTQKIIKQEKANNNLLSLDDFFDIIKYKIITSQNLDNIQDVEIGIINRFRKYINSSKNIDEFLEKVITKRYTYARLRRILVNIILDNTKDLIKNAKKKLPYIKILGINDIGQNYLNSIRKKINIDIITNQKKVSDKRYREYEIFLKSAVVSDCVYYAKSKRGDRKVPVF